MDRVDIGLGRTHVRPQGALRPQKGLDFIAIDFETANARRSSACAVGWAMVAGGRVVDGGSLLINPEAEFSRYNTAITGHDADSVAAAPTFTEVWPQLAAVLAGQTVVAHMATFDLTVLRQSVARYELQRIAKLARPSIGSLPTPVPSGQAPDVFEQLTRLASLRDQGVLTENEFAAKKAELLGRL